MSLTQSDSIKAQSVEAVTTANTVSLYTTQTGALNVGSSASRTGNITLGSSTNTGTITIATVNTNNTNALPAISIGADTGTKTIKINNNTNSVHCSSIDLNGSTINNITGTTGDISVGNLQTTAGVLNLGTSSTRVGNINIGATGGTPSYVINIGKTTTGAISIGSANNTTTVGTLTVLNPILLPSSYSSGLAATNLGFTYTANPGSTSPAGSGGNQSLYTVTNAGYYLFSFNINGSFTTAPTNFYFLISGANAQSTSKYYVTISGTNFSCSGSQYISCTATQYNLIINYTGGTGLAIGTTTSYFQVTRIA